MENQEWPALDGVGSEGEAGAQHAVENRRFITGIAVNIYINRAPTHKHQQLTGMKRNEIPAVAPRNGQNKYAGEETGSKQR